MIYTRHAHPNLLSRYTPFEVGFADAAEAFIFLSGLVSGRVYTQALFYGILFTQIKAIRRCLQIYVAHIFTLFVNLTLVSSLFYGTNASGVRVFQEPAQSLQRVFLLS